MFWHFFGIIIPGSVINLYVEIIEFSKSLCYVYTLFLTIYLTIFKFVLLRNVETFSVSSSANIIFYYFVNLKDGNINSPKISVFWLGILGSFSLFMLFFGNVVYCLSNIGKFEVGYLEE